MVKKLILTSNKILRAYEIKNLKEFKEKYAPISKVGNRYVYAIPKVIRKPRIVIRKPRIIEEPRIVKPKLRKPKVPPIPRIRIRKQICYNFKNSREPYAVSIRAITINPAINERGLNFAVREIISNLDRTEYFSQTKGHSILLDFSALSVDSYSGLEETEIAYSEDISLNNMKVHIAVKIEQDREVNFII